MEEKDIFIKMCSPLSYVQCLHCSEWDNIWKNCTLFGSSERLVPKEWLENE